MTFKCRVNTWRETFSRLATVRLLTASLLAAFLAAWLSSCGGEDAQLLPGETAREITANLDTVRSLADEGDCEGAQAATEQVGLQIEALSVDAELKQALREGATRLDEVVATCVPEISEETVEALPEPPEEPSDKAKKEKKGEEPDEKGDEEQPPPADEEDESSGEQSLPPQANGKAKGHEEQEESEESASGGISPGSSAEGGGD